jgi:hypothetical protein
LPADFALSQHAKGSSLESVVWEVRMITVLSLVDCLGNVPLIKKDLLGFEVKMTAVSNKIIMFHGIME